jgi:hypothetical protein
MFVAQTADFSHGRFAVGNRNGMRDEAALADIEFRGDGTGERESWHKRGGTAGETPMLTDAHGPAFDVRPHILPVYVTVSCARC